MDIKSLESEELVKLLSEIKTELDSRKKEEQKIVTVELTPQTASGRRESWFKKVDSVDSSQKGGYAYEGDFLKPGIELELKVGSIIIECSPHGSVKNGWKEGAIYKVKPDSALEMLTSGFDWQSESVSFRKEVEKYI
jgi:hypothetical protein